MNFSALLIIELLGFDGFLQFNGQLN